MPFATMKQTKTAGGRAPGGFVEGLLEIEIDADPKNNVRVVLPAVGSIADTILRASGVLSKWQHWVNSLRMSNADTNMRKYYAALIGTENEAISPELAAAEAYMANLLRGMMPKNEAFKKTVEEYKNHIKRHLDAVDHSYGGSMAIEGALSARIAKTHKL